MTVKDIEDYIDKRIKQLTQALPYTNNLNNMFNIIDELKTIKRLINKPEVKEIDINNPITYFKK